MGLRFQFRPNELRAIEQAETARLLEQADDWLARMQVRRQLIPNDCRDIRKPKDDG